MRAPLQNRRSPRLAHALLSHAFTGADRGHRLGDFEEMYQDLHREAGWMVATRWYWREVLRSMAYLATSFFQGSLGMIKNYLKVAMRKIQRQKGYALINILGLAIGMAATMLILLWVTDERSYDRFHTHADRIYRTAQIFHYGDWHLEQANTPAVLASTILDECPEAEMTTRLKINRDASLVKVDGKHFDQAGIGVADASFFQMFSFPLIHGDPATVLSEPSAVVLSASTARKYFGTVEAVGRTVNIYESDYRVSGVFEDMPPNAHFHAALLRSFVSFESYRTPNWGSNPFKTYVLLRDGARPEALQANLDEVVKRHMFDSPEKHAEASEHGNYTRFQMQALTDIHLNSHLLWEFEANGNATYVRFFTMIAMFTLLIATINYMNLATARSAGRAREVGIRKTMGSTRGALVRQFLSEAVLMALIALALSLVFCLLLMPSFRQLVGKPWLALPFIQHPLLLFPLIALVCAIGGAAGLYPSIFLSAFKPSSVLAGSVARGLKSGRLRSGLVVFQFTLSIILLVSTVVVQQQMGFIQSMALGYNPEQVLVIKSFGELAGNEQLMREHLMRIPDVVGVSASSSVPGSEFTNIGMRLEGSNSGHGRNLYLADEAFADVMGLDMAEGRYFSTSQSTDANAVIINESMVKELGEEELLGKRMMIWSGSALGRQPFHIIGIVKDFHYESLHETVKPLVIIKQYGRVDWEESYLSVRVRTDDMQKSVAQIRQTWMSVLPEVPFENSFLDEIYSKQYQNEIQTGHVFSMFTAFTLFVACLGLLGLASFAAEQRTKEIGIRKVLGASVQRLVLLLSSEFGKWVVLANVLAWPVAWWMMNRWLEQFAFKMEMGIGPFLLAAVMILGVTFVTVGFHGLRSARANPVKSLRAD